MEVIAAHIELDCLGGGSISDDKMSIAIVAELVRLVYPFLTSLHAMAVILNAFSLPASLDPDEHISRYNDTLTKSDTI